MSKNRQNIKSRLCMLTLIPLLFLGLATLIIASVSIYMATSGETRDGLKNLAYALLERCNVEGKGDYHFDNQILMKGQQIFDPDFSIVDHIKSVSDVDATIFYGDRRASTSIYKPNGDRAIGTQAASEVVNTVLVKGEDYYSQDVLVNNVSYFGYYTPLKNHNNQVIGMVFVGKTRKRVIDAITSMIFWIFILIVMIGSLAFTIAMIYANSMVYSIEKTKEFLGNIAKGNVSEKLDPNIKERRDEIGEMGHFLEHFKKSINEMVSTDPLTGLYNRRSCEKLLENVIDEYQKYKTPSVIVIGDVDLFKKVNDTYGHQTGDMVLQELSLALKMHMEHKGIAARWGGEEFMLIYERMPIERVHIHLEELRKLIQNLNIQYQGSIIHLTMTFGVAVCDEGLDMQSLIKLADDNLYYGKNHGRNQIVINEDE